MKDDQATPVEGEEGSLDELDLFQRLKSWYKDGRDHLGDWTKQAEEDYGFVAGEQWTVEDKAMLQEQLRPIITYNRIGPVVDSVAGLEVGNRQEIHYYPREVGDSGLNEMLTNAARFFREETDTEDEESDAFQDTIICGLGWLETRPDYEEDPEGLLPTERIDPLTTFYDPSAKKKNLVDRRYCGYAKEMDLEEAKSFFPDVDEGDLHAGWANFDKGADGQPHNATEAPFYREDQSNKIGPRRKKVTIVYFEWWEREPYHLVMDPFTGQKGEFSKDEFAKLKPRLAKLGVPVQSVPMTKKVYKRAFVGGKILRQGPGRCPYSFTLNCITGKRDRNANTWYGVVRAMKDPQKWANKFFSQILHVINSNAKGGIMAEKTAVDNVRKFEDEWADSNVVTWLKDGAIAAGKVQMKPAITYPAGLDKLMEFSIGSIRDVTGVNLELLGMADRQQAGVLEAQRKQAGMTILASMFDSLRRYRKIGGRVMLSLIQDYIPEGRLIRIDTENGPKYAALSKDQNVTKYDVIVDEAASSPNQKEVVWGMLQQLMPTLLAKANLPPNIWAELLKYSPLPESVSTKIGQALVEQANKPPAPDPKVEAMKMKGQIDQQRAQGDLAAQQQQMQIDAQRSQQEIEQSDIKFQQELVQDQIEFKQKMSQDAYKAQQASILARQKSQERPN